MERRPLSIVVLISGQGTNLQALIDAKAQGLPIQILAVISHKADAFGLTRAQQAGIATEVISHTDFSDREAFDTALSKAIDAYHPQFVVLAGFMRQLGKTFVHHYQNHLINIHPSLLPKHKGLHTHRAVLAAGETEHGVSIHYVTDDIDSGPIIAQAKLLVLPTDTEASLTERIHHLEHILYPQVLAWLAAGRIEIKDKTVYLDKKPLPPTGFSYP